jgi:hypothetical protein
MSINHRAGSFAFVPLALALLLPAAAEQKARDGSGTSGKPPAATDGRGTGADERAQAPVGHRQPRADDKPASVPKDRFDTKIEQLNREANRGLRICRDC